MGFYSRLKSALARFDTFRLLTEVKRAVGRTVSEARDPRRRRVVRLAPAGPPRGNVLISYFIEPFLDRAGASRHFYSNRWEALEMARTFLELGYAVDVIDARNRDFLPDKKYAVFVDERSNLPRLAPLLGTDCVKIMHIDCAHMLFQSTAEMTRLLALQQRKGVTLHPERFEFPNLAIEHADCATVLGNEFTMSTFRYAGKPLYRVPVSQPVAFPWPAAKDFDRCRRRFLWFGGPGLVHKGLDLVLDAFAELPEHHLTVCAPIRRGAPFETLYHRLLFETPNIHTAGWVDIHGAQFREIADGALGLVYVSASEGGGQSAINCLHAGLIPVVNRESSIDVDPDRGVLLPGSSIADIQRGVVELSGRPATELQSMARRSWEHVRAQHSRERFAAEYRGAIREILAAHGRL